MTARSGSITDVAGFTVGHWTDPRGATGCTVVLCPPGGARAAVAVRGRATGTRELDPLDPRHLVGHIDAILLTGGSAFGLGAADGVMTWLAQQRRGFPVRDGIVVPIVPTAVIFDLGAAGEPRWPGPVDAAAACAAAGVAVEEGSVGVGTGATVGKALGLAGAMKSGVGTACARGGEVLVGVLTVINAVGDVRDSAGNVLAGARDADGRFVDAVRYFAAGRAPFGAAAPATNNTTLTVVATNANIDKMALEGLARAANDALARRITPFGTQFDGDVTFAVATAAVPAATPLQVETLAALAVPQAVERAVRLARGRADLPGLADRT